MVAATSLLAGCTAAPAWKGAETSHFNGEVFSNSVPMQKGAWDMIQFGWGSLSGAQQWPEWVEVPQQQVPQARIASGLSVTFINHATFLIQLDGVNILTDPIFSERASPSQALGPARVHKPGIAFEDLPPIDVILISHNHYDHLDEGTLRRFAAMERQPLVVAGLGNGALFEAFGLQRFQELDWEQSISTGGVRFTFTECRHRSGRGLTDQMKTLWGAFAIHSASDSVYFGGDSGYGGHFRATGEKHGPFTLALLPIGAYEPRWFMADVHVNPREAVQAHIDLQASRSIGMHFGTFQLTYEAIDQPVTDLVAARAVTGVEDGDFIILSPGESALIVPAATPATGS
jgi:L-ascorbate metabolism protein UlaG (beta-lactamase superfamily)